MIAGKLLIYEKEYEIVCLSLLELALKIVVRSKEVIFVVQCSLFLFSPHGHYSEQSLSPWTTQLRGQHVL